MKGNSISIGSNSFIRIVTVCLALASGAVAEAQVPFKGTLHGQETDLFQGNPPAQIMVDAGAVPASITDTIGDKAERPGRDPVCGGRVLRR